MVARPGDSKNMASCIEACQACLVACERCIDAHLDEGGMAECTRLCRDGAYLCALCTSLMARLSRFHPDACALCATVCRACAEECQRHDEDHCRECAQACVACAEECEQMVAHAEPKT